MTDKLPLVLCVDDETSILRALRRVFLDEPWETMFAESGAEGLALLAEQEVDVVLSDFRMPGMNGVEFLKQVKESQPHCMRVILSGYADTDVIVAALNEGEIYRYVTKPWNAGELLDIVRKALDHRRLQRENAEVDDALRLARDVLEQLPVAIFGLDEEGVLVLANARARELDPCELDLESAATEPGRVAPLVVDDEVLGVVVKAAGMAELRAAMPVTAV
jgi:two-component system NtrC family sensor kinase